ncbi:MAG: HD domain-containing protein [Firmicutes bacterium]|nr:HD domain-containing protein [Bacillota bacterium]
MGFDEEYLNLSVNAAIMHDIGSVMISGNTNVAEIESQAKRIASMGAEMLSDLPKFDKIAQVIKYSQSSWTEIENMISDDPVKTEYAKISAIVHLADSISLMIVKDKPILNQAKNICDTINSCVGTEFMPEAAEAFFKLGRLEYIWLDLLKFPSYFLMIFTGKMKSLTLEETAEFVKIMSRIIDYRSPFTAMHSAGVAASAGELAKLCSMTEEECIKMEIAGYLHDIGKLIVPKEILEKPGKLSDEEFNIIKEHSYYTRLILMNVDGFSEISDWAGFHHEKLNGKGYPFHFDSEVLDKGSRIMAAADIFSAITEERPYRKGMSKEQAVTVMAHNTENGTLCPEIVKLLLDIYEQVEAARDKASREAGKRYFESIGKLK